MARTAAKHPQRPPTGMAAGTRHRDSVVDDLAPRSSLSILLPQPGAATQPAQRRLCGGAENADASSSTLPHAHGTRPGMQAAVLAIKTHSATVDRQRVAEEQQLGSAAAHVADAFRGETDTTLFKRPELQKLHLKMMWLRYVFMYIYLVIALVEVPNWCYEEATCTAPDGQPVPTFGLPVLPRTATQTVEFLCICFFTVHLAVKFLFVGGTSFWASRWNYLKVVLLLVSGIDIVIFTAADLIWPTVSSGQPRNLIRLAPFLRPVVVAFIDGHTREDVVRLASTIWAVRHVLALIVVLVLWFGLVLFVLFNQFCPGPPLVPACDATISGDAVGADFNTIDGSSLSVFIMLTTSNFPIIMMQVYSFNRLFAVPFIIFLLFGLFFLMNAVLANVYSAYKKQIKSRAVDFNHAQTQSLKMAFDLLVSLEMQHESVEDTVEMPSRPAKSPKNCISVEILRQLLAELRGFGSQSLQLENLDSVIAKVDVNADGFINREEFDDLCILLPLSTGAMQIEHQSQGRCCSSCGCFCLVGRKQDAFQLWLRELVHSINFLRFVQGVIIVNAITIYIEVATEFVAEVDSPRENHFKFGLLEAFELCFATCYILEMTAKLLVLGWARYWRSWRNTLDGMVSLSSAVVELAVIVTLLTERQVLLLRTIIYVRLLLVIRVFSNFAPFTQLFAAFFELVPLFGNLLKALFIMMCFFAQIGVSWFGGKIYDGAPKLVGSQYADSNFYANNFNDFGSALMTLFELMIVNDWYVIADGFVRTCGQLAWLFFIAYYIVGVIAVLNLVTSCVVEKYVEHVELVDAVVEAQFGEGQREQARTLFRKYDIDNSGTIDKRELGEMLAKMGIEATSAEVQEMIAVANGDDGDVLDEAEFLAMIQHRCSHRYLQLLKELQLRSGQGVYSDVEHEARRERVRKQQSKWAAAS